jgi:hypothetical protein
MGGSIVNDFSASAYHLPSRDYEKRIAPDLGSGIGTVADEIEFGPTEM